MGGFKAVIANGTARCKANVHNRGPALKLVMSVMVKQIRDPDGRSDPRCFDGCESRVIVDYFVGEQDFLPATTAHIERGKIVKRARRCYADKEPIVGLVPKSVLVSGSE